VIAGHRVIRDRRMMSRPMNPSNVIASAVISILMSNDYAVDIFFLLSSILVTHSLLRAFDA
jgi:peptidoglycan/LPS O-acetylase OafA/YrhL